MKLRCDTLLSAWRVTAPCLRKYSTFIDSASIFRSRAGRLKYCSIFAGANNLNGLRDDASWFLCNFNTVQLPLLDNRYCGKNDCRSSIFYSEASADAISDTSTLGIYFYSYSYARYLHKVRPYNFVLCNFSDSIPFIPYNFSELPTFILPNLRGKIFFCNRRENFSGWLLINAARSLLHE